MDLNSSSIGIFTEKIPRIACPSCGAELDVSEFDTFEAILCPACQGDIRVPARLGEYLLLEELGRGAMGCVYLALDESLGREVALKVMRREFGDNPEMLDTLQREAQSMATLNHRNVVHVYSFGKQAGQPYFVMELLDGERLDQMMAGGTQIDEVRALELMVDVADGLAAAHSIDMTHGDIKPANILMDREGIAKVVDFGLARFADPDAEIEVWGTPFYIAPEKARKKGEDARSDQYSLGATMFHALAGAPPYEGKDPTRVVIAALKTETPNLRDIRPELQPTTCDVIYRMMQKAPDDRFQEFEELSTALREALDIARDVAEKRRIAELEAQMVKPKNTLLPTLLATGALLLIGISAVVIVQSRKPAALASKYEGRRVDQPLTRKEVRNLSEAADAFLAGRLPDMVRNLKNAGRHIPPEHEAHAWWHILGGVIAQQAGAVKEAQKHFEQARDQQPIVFQAGTTPSEDPRILASFLLEPIDAAAANEKLQLTKPYFRHLGALAMGLRLQMDGKPEEAQKQIDVYTSVTPGSIDWPYILQALFKEPTPDDQKARRNTENLAKELAAIQAHPVPVAPPVSAPPVAPPKPEPVALDASGRPRITHLKRFDPHSFQVSEQVVLPRWEQFQSYPFFRVTPFSLATDTTGLLPQTGAMFSLSVRSKFTLGMYEAPDAQVATLLFVGDSFRSINNFNGMWVGSRKGGSGGGVDRLAVILQRGTQNVRTWEFPLAAFGLSDNREHTVAVAWHGGGVEADMSLVLIIDDKVLFLERLVQNGMDWMTPPQFRQSFSVGCALSADQKTCLAASREVLPATAVVWAKRVSQDTLKAFYSSK